MKTKHLKSFRNEKLIYSYLGKRKMAFISARSSKINFIQTEFLPSPMWDHLMGTNYTGAGSEKGGARADHAKQQVNALLIMLRVFKRIL